MEQNALTFRIDKLYENFAASANEKGRYFFMLDIQRDIARWSPASVTDFGLPGEYTDRNSQTIREYVAKEDADAFLEDVQRAKRGILERKETEWRMKVGKDKYIPCAVKIFTVKDYTGIPSYLGVAITSLVIDSQTDPTTNLPGQVRFLEHLRGLFTKRRRAVVMLVGTMNFSDINNIYGYSFGNRVIAALSDRLKEQTAGNGELFRGEGTMILFCSENMSVEEMTRMYQDLRNFALQMLAVDGNRIPLKLSAGIVVADDPTVDVHAILASVKFAENRSETSEDGAPVVLRNDYLSKNDNTLKMVAALRKDVELNCRNMALNYQPILDARTDKVLGGVAYLRWQREDGNISPAQFLPWLENDDSFVELSNWIVRRALAEGKHMLTRNPNLVLMINLSHRQLGQPEFHQYLLNIIKKREFPGRNLCLELTDRCRFLNLDFLRHEIVFFKSCGILVALDGSCLLDLHLVRELPVDLIKIGRDFTSNIKKNAKDGALLRGLCSFAKESNIMVCAEGIEDKEMLDMIKEYDISAYQGYVASGAVSMEEFINLPLLRK